jgi:Bax protein|tara:strand:+ start:354 stop:995 length:642 start_codon:yes stop_codon:yes gene_type:complete
MRQNITSGLIAVVITFITFYFLNYSYNTVDEITSIKVKTPKVDQDFIDDIKVALSEPDIISGTNEQFVASLDSCIDYVYKSVSKDYRLPKEMIVAQAVLESGWGRSRFANEANNLFGIRTFDKSDKWMLPESKKDWTGWGVKVYSSKCASVRDYVRIINEVWAYEELRLARAENPNISAEELSIHLYRFSTNPKYTKLVINIIKTKLGEYDLS